MLVDVFKPAQPGLTPQQSEARNERERTALNALAMVTTTGPMPDDFTISLMQGYVDGEITLEEAEAKLMAEISRKFGV